MPDPAHFQANFQRAIALFNAGRPNEAVPYAQAAIAADPDNAHGYCILAQCWNAIPAQRPKSIAAINRAIGLEPNISYFHGLKAWFYVCLQNFHAARRAANDGLAIDPNCIQSLNGLANAHTKLRQWRAAETVCRRILAIDPNDAPALNLLAQALRHQGRYKESRQAVDQLLANMPNNAFGHANAGHAALAAGDHLRANQHFLESLRLDPHFDFARKGLLSSLRARIWIIRWNVRLFCLINRPPSFLNVVGILVATIAVFILMTYAVGFLEKMWPVQSGVYYGIVFCLPVVYPIFYGFVCIVANFLLMFDPFGRHALTRREKIRAVASAIIFAAVAGLLFPSHLYAAVAGIVILFVFVAFTIQTPLWYDRLQRRRLEQAG